MSGSTAHRDDSIDVAAFLATVIGFLWRFHTGRPLFRKEHKPAPGAPPGRHLEPRSPADDARKEHAVRTRRRRGCRRSVIAWTLIAVLYGLGVAATLTIWVVAVAGLVTLLGTAIHLTGKWAGRDHRHDIVDPLTRDLTHAIGPPRDVQVEPDQSEVTIALPRAFSVMDRDKVTELVRAGVPLISLTGAPDVSWNRTRWLCRPYVTFAHAVPMPGMVAWALIRDAAAACDEHEVILGRTRKNPYKISVNNDSPHFGLSMPSGEGKSVTARLIAAQLAHHGALAIILDRKLTSHQWATGLPNVAYARSIEQVHELCLWLAAEVDRRNKIAVEFADVEGKVDADPGPRICGLLEELNTTANELKAYWKSIGGDGISPAVIALDKVAFTGRAVAINLIYIGQRLSAKATGGGSADSRENLGVKLMSPNVAKSTWKMLIGDQHAQPEGSDVKGRLYVVGGKSSTEVQGGFMTGAEAREWAQSGRIAEVEDDMPCLGPQKVLAPVGTPERAIQDAAGLTPRLLAGLVPGHDKNAVQAPDLGDVRDIEDSEGTSGTRLALVPPLLVTGPEAIEQGILPMFTNWEAARKAIQRAQAADDPRAPRPATGKDGQVLKRGAAPLYDSVKFDDWTEYLTGAAPDERKDA